MRQSSLAVNQTSYFALDIAKFLAAFLVVSIHVPSAHDANKAFLMWLRDGFARLAVPFFFCAAGFFLAQKGIDDVKAVKRYLGRIGLLYVLWSAVYFPFVVQSWRSDAAPVFRHALTYARNSVVVGSYLHLWYFPALMLGVALLYALRRLPVWLQLSLAAGLYVVGVCGNAYETKMRILLPFLEPVAAFYTRFFLTTRNGLLFAFPFVCMGAAMARRQVKHNVALHAAGLGASLLLLCVEIIRLQSIAPETQRDMMLSLVPSVYFLFVLLLRAGKKTLPVCRWLRDCSVLLYALHPMLFLLLRRFLTPFSGVGQYLLVSAASLCVCALVLRVQQIACLRWLHLFY